MASNNTKNFIKALGNSSVPVIHRALQLQTVMKEAAGGNEDYQEMVGEIFNRLQEGTVDERNKEKQAYLDAIIKQIEESPLRPATFIEMSKLEKEIVPHAMVAMDNGEFGLVVAHDQQAAKKLKLGDRVLMSGDMKLLVTSVLNELKYGPEARFERRINGRHIEVISQQDERSVVMVGPKIIEQIENGDIKPGAAIILNTGRNVGLVAVPKEETEFSHFRFLDKGAIPDVRVDRDIGCPPRIIEQVGRHVREEMTRPDLRRKFKLRPCSTHLLCGVSGTGKTLAVQAIHRLMYEIMSEITGVPMAELPPRVFRFRASQAFSMWFGESDKNIDRFFDEVEQMADKKFRDMTLPVLVVMEEADGIGRARGGDQIYDRIMTTTLQRMDPSRSSLANKLVVFLSTTNEPHIVDPAFLRRIGGEVEEFGRLNQDGFNSVLAKHVNGLPTKKGWKNIVSELDHHLFDAEQSGIVEMSVQGQRSPFTKYRRDFLTGALIERAVQQAAKNAWETALEDPDKGFVTSEQLLEAIDQQVTSVVNQLTENNVDRYTDLPDGVRITSVRRIQPAVA